MMFVEYESTVANDVLVCCFIVLFLFQHCISEEMSDEERASKRHRKAVDAALREVSISISLHCVRKTTICLQIYVKVKLQKTELVLQGRQQ